MSWLLQSWESSYAGHLEPGLGPVLDSWGARVDSVDREWAPPTLALAFLTMPDLAPLKSSNSGDRQGLHHGFLTFLPPAAMCGRVDVHGSPDNRCYANEFGPAHPDSGTARAVRSSPDAGCRPGAWTSAGIWPPTAT